MVNSAPTYSARTYPMAVANMTFMVDRLGQDCAPLQFVRELTQNSIESICALESGKGEIRWDADWNLRQLESDNKVFKLAIIDTGVGMTGPEMVQYINHLSSSIHEQSKHGNFGMGAKIAAVPLNPEGLLYLSWKNGKGAMIHLWKDPSTNTYGLRRFEQTSEYWLPIEDSIKPEPIKNHGTMVVMLGKNHEHDTMTAPADALIPSRWVLRYLNTRYFRFPEGVTMKAREGWHLPRSHKHNMLRKVTGQEEFLKNNSESSGTVELEDATAYWWILKPKVDASGHYVSGGHMAALYDNELFELVAGSSGVARLQSFGVIFGYSKVVVYVEPTNGDGRLSANTARTNLLVSGEPLPWQDWATEFRNKMPEPIQQLMDKLATGDSDGESQKSIRDRLKQIRDLLRFSRYRRADSGADTIDDEMITSGGRADASTKSSGGGGGNRGGGRGGGSHGDVYALFAATGDTPAESVEGISEPRCKWVSLKDGTRTPEFLEDRAAKYVSQVNMIQINADFRVFTDMIDRWKKRYEQHPASGTAVERYVREWFEQQLMETVIGALALRKSGNWSEQEVENLWSPEALTSAVLPRYHIDQSIKRTLGQKLGSLKDVA